MSKSSPVVIHSDSSDTEGSPVKIIKSPHYRRVFRTLDEDEGSCRKKLKFEEIDPETASCSLTSGQTVSPTLHSLAYEKPPLKYTAESILKRLLDPKLDYTRVCTVWPLVVESSATFIIDVTKLKHPDDVRKDFFGKWNHSGSHPLCFKARVNDEDVEVEWCAACATGDVYYLRRLHCNHPSNPNFRRLIAFVSDKSYNPHPVCLVVYYIPPGFSPAVLPHGNAKSSKPFYPTLPSTASRIRSECHVSGPKEVVGSISAECGGIVGATYPGELPRDEQQVSDIKRHDKAIATGSSRIRTEANELYTVMLQAHLEDSSNKFARDIKMYPEPAIMLGNDRQIVDVVRFCCDPFESCILTVDPTFCLGNFDVTPTTYRHLFLRSARTGSSPVMIGPTLIHYKKAFQTYLFFSSSLVGQNKKLEHLRAFGTDGEVALSDAFSHSFRFATHLTCFIHVRRNIKDKLTKCGVPEAVKNEILDDIFGKKIATTLVEGLVDSEDEHVFEENLRLLVLKWKKRDSDCDSDCGKIAEFCAWLLKNKVDVIRNTMLRQVREEAGLGSPPEPFSTNASECVNSIIKRKVEYKRNELPQFIHKLRELCEEQQREVERAIVGRGKYRLRPQYSHFGVAESKWFVMSQEQRRKHLKLFNEAPVSNIRNPESVASGSDISSLPSTVSEDTGMSASALSEKLMSLSPHLSLPAAAIEAIARKAAEILKTDNGIAPAPGCSGIAQNLMVMSNSGKRPHMVVQKKNGSLICDSDCPQYQSAAVCSHVVAAAIHIKQFDNFIASYSNVKRMPNLTKLAKCEMPKGRGRKGGKAPAKRKTSVAVEQRIRMDLPTCSSTVITQSPTVSPYVNVPSASAVDISPSFHIAPPYFPSYPPPSMDPFSNSQHPFRLHFVTGNISVCHGCKGRYHKDLGPPHDLCIQHEEWRTFTVSGSTPQSRFSNVYYHANIACIFAVWPSFVMSSLVVPPDVLVRLNYEHKQWLYSQFGMFID